MTGAGGYLRTTGSLVHHRAFNSLAWKIFENPQFAGMPADLFYCGQPAPDRLRWKGRSAT
jgi:hypothetical protein